MTRNLLLIALSFVSLSVSAQERIKSNLATQHISGDVQLLSQYIERGLSMSDNNPAMNASFLYNLGSQVRMGFWGSNISNLSAVDDNFWFKILAQFDVQFGTALNSKFYISDDHYYKSNQRNGQKFGVNFDYYTYTFGFEWMSNLEGTDSNAEYLYFGKYFYWSGSKIRYGGVAGYTMSHNRSISSYLDLKAVAQYLLNTETTFEAAITVNSNNSYFGKRGDPALYIAAKLVY